MPFLDVFRNLFGGRRSEEPRNEDFRFFDYRHDSNDFRNPIWQNDEDEDDVDDFRRPRSGMHFRVYSDPLEITRYFESQMNDMLRTFGFGFNQEDVFSLPAPQQDPLNESLRDKMLKRGYDHPDQFNEAKLDTDLDGKISPDEFSKVWGKSNNNAQKFHLPEMHITGQTIRKEIIHRSDGTVEQKQILRDSEGNEKTIVSRQSGDKIYTVTTNKDRNGIETRTEDLVNIDESELQNFIQGLQGPSSAPHIPILDSIPWERFFGPNPKL